jgi:hypothetical protein
LDSEGDGLLQSGMEHRPLHRRARLLFGLVLAAIVPGLLSAPIILAMITEGMIFGWLRTVQYGASYFISAILWSVASGNVSLFEVVWRDRPVTRAACILAGCAGAATFPLAWAAFAGVLGSSINVSALGFALMIGVFALPFGALGGWIFWRLARRWAPAVTADVAPVFD